MSPHLPYYIQKLFFGIPHAGKISPLTHRRFAEPNCGNINFHTYFNNYLLKSKNNSSNKCL